MAISDNFSPNKTDGDQSALPKRFVELTDDGAISIADGTVFLNKGSAIAATLDTPPTDMDGARLTIHNFDGSAHTVTQSTPGFNSAGTASVVATFSTDVGGQLDLVAKSGVWYTVNVESVTENVTIADS